jgi:TrmH family RNA methyltransferase
MPKSAIKKYKSDFDYSYTLGIYPTIELLKNKADTVEKVLVSTKLVESEGFAKTKSLCSENNIEIVQDDRPFKILSSKENIYVIGVFKKYPNKIELGEDTLVLNKPDSAGNVGTIIRTMVGFDVRNLAVIKPCVDLYSPEVVRASMGALFRINFEYLQSLDMYRDKTSNNVYYFSTGGKNLSDAEMVSPFSLVFGNEGEGLSKKDISGGTEVTIQMSRGIDSYRTFPRQKK